MKTYVTHSKRFESQHVSLADLRGLPAPEPLSPYHKPIHHADLVDGILAEVERRDLVATRTQFALGAKGAALFGVIDLAPVSQALVPVSQDVPAPVIQAPGQNGLSLGFRAANDYSLALRAVAGSRVFVCDNLALSGDMVAWARKHTSGLDLADTIARGFDLFLNQAAALANAVAALADAALDDAQAKVIVYEVFAAKILPVKLFDDVVGNYFDEDTLADRPDCQPRNRWGLHNAMTRAIKDLKPVPAFTATTNLGRFFGLSAHSGSPVDPQPVIDVEPVDPTVY